jgi:hypothetical protein
MSTMWFISMPPYRIMAVKFAFSVLLLYINLPRAEIFPEAK